MEMTLLPMMDPTALVLTESAPLSSGPVPAAGDSTAFAALLETAALGVEAMMIAPDSEENSQGMVPLPAMRQNGGVQDPAERIILQLAQLNGQNVPSMVTESPVEQLPLPSIKSDAATDTEIKLAVTELDPHASETEPASTQEDLQVALATMAMASVAGQQPRETTAPPAPQATVPQVAIAPANAQQKQPVTTEVKLPAEAMPPEPVVFAQPEHVRAGNNALPQQEKPDVPAPAAVMKSAPGRQVPVLEQGTALAIADSPAASATPVEQKASKTADVTRTEAANRFESLQVSEPRKTLTSLPLNVAIEVTVAEQSNAVGAVAESGQFPGQNSQEQSTAPQQQMAQLSTQPARVVEITAASAQSAALPISHESLLEQVREQLVRREVNPDGNQVRLKLNPAELGELQINLHLDDQRLRVEILTENKAVKAALLDNMDSLKDILARQHIAVDRFDVGSGSSFGQFFREGNRPEEQSRPMPKFLHGSGFNPGSESGRTVAAWQPRSNALVDVRF